MWALRNGLLVNWKFFSCVSVSSLLTQTWLRGAHSYIKSQVSWMWSYCEIQSEELYLQRKRKKKKTNVLQHLVAWAASVCVCVCVCVWPYFPLSAVCSYSNQYVSCLHWSGLDNHHSYMVSPQQMPETDRGAERKKPNEKVEGCTGWENVSVKHAAPQTPLRFLCILSERGDSRIVSGIGLLLKYQGATFR